MTPEQRARDLFDFFLRRGWVKEEDRKAVGEGMELAVRAAEDDAAVQSELRRCEIERMAGERHLLHSSLGKEDGFWGCSRGPCKRAAEYLRGLRPWRCAARHAGTAGGNHPQDCNWPFCGCDPAASRVLEAVEESGRLERLPPDPIGADEQEGE